MMQHPIKMVEHQLILQASEPGLTKYERLQRSLARDLVVALVAALEQMPNDAKEQEVKECVTACASGLGVAFTTVFLLFPKDVFKDAIEAWKQDTIEKHNSFESFRKSYDEVMDVIKTHAGGQVRPQGQ